MKNSKRKNQQKRRLAIRKPEQLMVRAETAAELCGIGKSLWYELIQTGKAPPSIKLGRARLWKVEDLRRWVKLGCPKIERYMEIREAENET